MPAEVDPRTTGDRERLKVRLRILYDSYRTALLNKKYYGHRLVVVQRFTRWSDIVIAATATGSSGIGAWTVWSETGFKELWGLIAMLAAVLTLIKPFMGWSKKTEDYSKLFTGHAKIAHAFRMLIDDIRYTQQWTDDLERRFSDARGTFGELETLDDPKPSAKLTKRFQAEVNHEVPPSSLWMPA